MHSTVHSSAWLPEEKLYFGRGVAGNSVTLPAADLDAMATEAALPSFLNRLGGACRRLRRMAAGQNFLAQAS